MPVTKQPQVSWEALHKSWISDGRRKTKDWAVFYKPRDFAVPLAIIKDDLRVHFQNTKAEVLRLYDRHANPVTVSSDLWHWFGRDAREVFEARGYISVPNALLDKPSTNHMAGAGDILLLIPTAKTPSKERRVHAKIALEALNAKRERTARMKDNAENGLRKLDKQIREVRALI